jgi:hypothetical protein
MTARGFFVEMNPSTPDPAKRSKAMEIKVAGRYFEWVQRGERGHRVRLVAGGVPEQLANRLRSSFAPSNSPNSMKIASTMVASLFQPGYRNQNPDAVP